MTQDSISRFRRFSRAVTSQMGVLDQDFLGLGRPLGPARVLNAIGHGLHDISQLREYLRLDSGLMSRLLRQLEAEGLITTTPGAEDKRRRQAHLTPAGATEYAAYERLSDARAHDCLARHPKPDALLAAMDLVASALGRDHIQVQLADPCGQAAQDCLEAYYADLSSRFGQRFDPVRSGDPEASAMRPPDGAFVLAVSDGLAIGCGGLKPLADSDMPTGEVKRVWVSPNARGMGVSRQLMQALEGHARDLGMRRLRLDTSAKLSEARGLYRATGWTEVARYNDNPYADHFFEKVI
ncbi:PadR family transcriptional regulator [Thioclava sp. SK-1]|uniref:bifunctional helix-turn-helix transcriptional regulator/GNAT family N-acetyltransferase n=1 Tax=Thioclava sp. SK-1 TaxID=1889770 RepID=UPI00082660B9|nr:helix-turn-helix domain-containing GNAT family N-acetyltransferase [Thioclava sp. SK-1]OCX67120.1 PadR family transcriptional regulator [Thioclava sp. SK-1]